MKLADAKTMRRLDAAAVTRYGVAGLILMENAGRGVFESALKALEGSTGKRVSVIAGKGNNGGDGFVVARHLKNSGFDVKIFSTATVSVYKGDAAVNAIIWKKMGGETSVIRSVATLQKESSWIKHSSLVIDALLGTGVTGDVRGIAATVIDFINEAGRPVLAVDIPSGICADTGAVLGSAVRATRTATMALSKIGLHLYPGREYAGEVDLVDIGMPSALFEDKALTCELIDDTLVKGILRPKPADGHKGTSGRLLALAGSTGMTGAAAMAGLSALRAGAGLVTIGVPESLNPVMEVKCTEVMTFPLPEASGVTFGEVSVAQALKIERGKDAVILGPGLGNSGDTFKFVKGFLSGRDAGTPILIDADALNVLSGRAGIIKKAPGDKVITPHPGEASRLLGISIGEIQGDRVAAAKKLSKATGAVAVLKGGATVVASPDGRVFINPTGNALLATAGSGDILSGMIGGLLARGYDALGSATAGVYLHGLAADIAREELGGTTGMAATDLLGIIPSVFNDVQGR